MPQCYKVDLGDAMLANQTLAELKIELLKGYAEAISPQNMWAFYRHESAGVYCNLVIYLSVELQREVLLTYAVSSSIPSLSDACFFIGEQVHQI